MFYAVGYTNDGANEKKLGPFTTKDEAMKAGRSEAGITRGFSFSGVVDDSGNYVYHNSRACNSTNPVVANAMKARNATCQYHDYDVPVIQLGHRKYITIMGVADEETAKALARSSPGITIDESRKVKVKNASGGVARNAMQDAGSYVRECNKFIPEANVMIREWDAFYKKMTAKRKWYDSKMTELRDGFYRIDKGDPDYDKARAAYDALRDVSRSAEAVHLFYSV